MLKEIKQLLNDQVITESMKRYGIDETDIKKLRGFESFVYEYTQGTKSYILKFNHELRRTEAYILGEIEWLNYLQSRGISVCKPIASIDGNYVEKVDSGGTHFLLTSYEKAPGHPIQEQDWDIQLFEQWGQFVGRMHAVTKNYRLNNPVFKRQEWYEEEQLKARVYLPAARETTISCIENLIGRLKQLPKDKDSYGLVHSDLHQKNFFVQNGSITTFDFDDAGYHYFISDIAIIFYIAICYPVKKSDDQSEFAKLFFHHFMEGYLRENHLDSFWYDTIPDFIRMRHALALVTFYQISNISALKENQLELLEQHHFEVENRMPAFPFESLR